MKQRCYNENSSQYHSYGGRGITVCDRWRNSFANFCQDMGPRPPGYTIERKNNSGNYEPDNCIWATTEQQAKNKTTNRVIEWRGQKMIITEAAKQYGLSVNTLRNRLDRGWSVEEALTTPVR